jgi:hypothetical protein
MKMTTDLYLAILAHAAPLLGLALWLTPFSFTGGGGWDFAKMFTLGLYMAAMGLLVPLVIWLMAGPGLVKTEAFSAFQFHGVIALIALGLGLLMLAATAFDPSNPTMSNPPKHFEAVLAVIFLLSTSVLPIVELARVFSRVRRVLH